MVKTKQTVKGRSRKQTAGAGGFRAHGFFKREAEWMSLMNLAPFGIGVLLALVFWFTR